MEALEPLSWIAGIVSVVILIVTLNRRDLQKAAVVFGVLAGLGVGVGLVVSAYIHALDRWAHYVGVAILMGLGSMGVGLLDDRAAKRKRAAKMQRDDDEGDTKTPQS